jgi:hypothetical protein
VRWGSAGYACALVAVACLAGAGPAEGASIFANKVCYQEREPVLFAGLGYTPGGLVDIRRDGQYLGALRAGAKGGVAGRIPAPVVHSARGRPFAIVARDRTNPGVVAQITRLGSLFEVKVRPTSGDPNRRRRITARGFTSGMKLYVHIRRAGRVRNVSLGTLNQPCGTKSTRKRIFRRGTRRGTYKVQFDTFRKYSATRVPRVTFTVTIVPVFRGPGSRAASLHPSAGRATLSERWVRTFP